MTSYITTATWKFPLLYLQLLLRFYINKGKYNNSLSLKTNIAKDILKENIVDF